MLSIQTKLKVIMFSIFLSAVFDEGVEYPTINRAKICSVHYSSHSNLSIYKQAHTGHKAYRTGINNLIPLKSKLTNA